jgi:hypothetical protein
MKFFILGDSFGLGEWEVNSGIMELVPNTGLDFYLKQLGHSTTNASAGSASNFGQLRNAYWRLKEDSDYDYIIWFHTEPIRDVVTVVIDDPIDGVKQYPDFKNIKDYHKAMSYINNQNYIYAHEQIYKEFKIPWIVIGGVGRLDDTIDTFDFAKYKIYSWAEELLRINYRLPSNQMHWHRWEEVFSTFKYNKHQVLEELSAVTNYQKLTKISPLFPDHMHVIRTEYEKLAHRILKLI